MNEPIKRKRPVRRLKLDNEDMRGRLRKVHDVLDLLAEMALCDARYIRGRVRSIRKLIGRKPKI